MLNFKTMLLTLTLALAATASYADNVRRTGLSLEGVGTATAWLVNANGAFTWVTTEEELRGRTPQTDRVVMIAPASVDLWDQGDAVAFMQANFGSRKVYVFDHTVGGRLRPGDDGVFGPVAGPDGIQNTPDDLPTDDYETRERTYF